VHSMLLFRPLGVTKKRKAKEDINKEVTNNLISKRKALYTLG
jgi:hypothetical protein